MTTTKQVDPQSTPSDPQSIQSERVVKVSRRGLIQAGLGLGASGLLLGFKPTAMLAKPSAAAAAAAADSGVVFSPNVYVEIEESGKIRLIVHRTEMGQGVRTSLPMMLAEELEVDLDAVGPVDQPAASSGIVVERLGVHQVLDRHAPPDTAHHVDRISGPARTAGQLHHNATKLCV